MPSDNEFNEFKGCVLSIFAVICIILLWLVYKVVTHFG
jgi:hypothetical protein